MNQIISYASVNGFKWHYVQVQDREDIFERNQKVETGNFIVALRFTICWAEKQNLGGYSPPKESENDRYEATKGVGEREIAKKKEISRFRGSSLWFEI